MAVSLRRDAPERLILKVPSAKRQRPKKNGNWRKVLLAALTLYFVYSSAGQVRLAWDLRQRLHQVEREIAATEQRAEELRQEIAYLKSDAYIEKVAREELGLVRPGEIIFMPAPQ